MSNRSQESRRSTKGAERLEQSLQSSALAVIRAIQANNIRKERQGLKPNDQSEGRKEAK